MKCAETTGDTTRFLHGSDIEIIRDIKTTGLPEHVVFDFDGTLSLIREGWQKIMSDLIVEMLSETGTSETDAELSVFADEFIAETTGIQTVYQMIRLAEEVEKRGMKPADPLTYKLEFNQRLLDHVKNRRESLRRGTIAPEELSVPYAHAMLRELVGHGVTVHLASGTDVVYVREEASLLGFDTFFGENIHGAIKDYRSYSKEIIIQHIIEEYKITGARLAGFGDGFVDMETVKAAGGTAIAVASDETGTSGTVDTWKRERLIRAGADIVIPDFRDYRQLISHLMQTS